MIDVYLRFLKLLGIFSKLKGVFRLRTSDSYNLSPMRDEILLS